MNNLQEPSIEITNMKRIRFSADEDKLLDELVKNKRNRSWKEIAANFPGRTAAQCRDRYNQYLFKKIANKQWTPEEDNQIVELYKQFGPHWVKIANFLPGRSGNNVKNRWNSALTKFHGIAYTATKQERRSKNDKWTDIDNAEAERTFQVSPISIQIYLHHPNRHHSRHKTIYMWLAIH